MRTGAIISEVEHEIKILNEESYQRNLRWLLILEDLIEKVGFVRDNGDLSSMPMDQIRDTWLDERALLRRQLKESFNPFFGSVSYSKSDLFEHFRRTNSKNKSFIYSSKELFN